MIQPGDERYYCQSNDAAFESGRVTVVVVHIGWGLITVRNRAGIEFIANTEWLEPVPIIDRLADLA